MNVFNFRFSCKPASRQTGRLFAVLLSMSASAFAAQPATLEEIDARIQEVEGALIRAQAARYQQKHHLEYNDPKAAPKYQQAKGLEKEVLDLRRDLDNRLRVTDPEVRRLEKEIARLNQESSSHRQLAEAIGRELTAAESAEGDAAEEQVALLRFELAQAEAQRDEKARQALETVETLNAHKEQAAAKDPEAADLLAQLRDREAAYREQFGELHQTMNQHPDVKALDADRQKLVQELQELRRARERLVAGESR
ncbi:MAG TPA: hypothetical protein PKE26_10575 [Kiritimatiellia bacterium]|nr:hypothetical protein [Kiritimatiellia bacterium]HMO99542.1 hypothetical protein [Kiritimatiellia bacterium]